MIKERPLKHWESRKEGKKETISKIWVNIIDFPSQISCLTDEAKMVTLSNLVLYMPRRVLTQLWGGG